MAPTSRPAPPSQRAVLSDAAVAWVWSPVADAVSAIVPCASPSAAFAASFTAGAGCSGSSPPAGVGWFQSTTLPSL
jgi:hypothetical protein